jgi:FkbM family methyltransferase
MPSWSKRPARTFIERRGFKKPFDRALVDTIWIDVGAHLGQFTLDAALRNPKLLVFAFEPNWTLARQIMGRAANFVVLPMAISDRNGSADFFVNACDGSSSLVEMEESGKAHWRDLDLNVESRVVVPTMRLDTFMHVSDLSKIDYLKVDAEGVDLKVIQSAGERLRDIRTIKLEVDVAPDRLYQGAPSRDEVIEFMLKSGFVLVDSESQNQDRQQNLTFTSTNQV